MEGAVSCPLPLSGWPIETPLWRGLPAAAVAGCGYPEGAFAPSRLHHPLAWAAGWARKPDEPEPGSTS